jgi:hypothetical protein
MQKLIIFLINFFINFYTGKYDFYIKIIYFDCVKRINTLSKSKIISPEKE